MRTVLPVVLLLAWKVSGHVTTVGPDQIEEQYKDDPFTNGPLNLAQYGTPVEQPTELVPADPNYPLGMAMDGEFKKKIDAYIPKLYEQGVATGANAIQKHENPGFLEKFFPLTYVHFNGYSIVKFEHPNHPWLVHDLYVAKKWDPRLLGFATLPTVNLRAVNETYGQWDEMFESDCQAVVATMKSSFVTKGSKEAGDYRGLWSGTGVIGTLANRFHVTFERDRTINQVENSADFGMSSTGVFLIIARGIFKKAVETFRAMKLPGSSVDVKVFLYYPDMVDFYTSIDPPSPLQELRGFGVPAAMIEKKGLSYILGFCPYQIRQLITSTVLGIFLSDNPVLRALHRLIQYLGGVPEPLDDEKCI
mmetsp:Transcript_11800/g.19880  ORF Transcript_11800/g.19880 Transcript_11800/m.19880 type:complete len:362 (+) Transcript_11800:104-1189(+)